MYATLLALACLLAIGSASDVTKRVVFCDGTLNEIDPVNCASASEGTLCLSAADAGLPDDNCGCLRDEDCWSISAFPYCSEEPDPESSSPTQTNFCQFCGAVATGNPATDVSDHLFCRDRFPSEYLFTRPDGFVDRTETVAPATPTPGATGQFREVCNRDDAQGGACEPCHAVNPSMNPDITFPDFGALYGYTTGQSRGARGSVHCQHVYPQGNRHGEARPICAFTNTFTHLGIQSLFTTLQVEMNIAYNANGPDQVETRTPQGWSGACIPCFLEGIARHSLCNFSNPVRPICTEDAGCSPCASNDECASDVDCADDATCTGGANCMANGRCRNCVNDADCAGNDGPSGTPARNLICETNSGICIDAVPCDDNDDCDAGENCMLDGLCRPCTTNNDCVTNDGGSAQNQPTCDAGVCRDCEVNADCTGTGGANCQANGRCLNCGNQVNSANCGAQDGGETPGQTVCNTATNICETACTTNAVCQARGGTGFNRGLNCQADGTCFTCTTNANCGNLDGGETAGQTTCEAGICVNPFDCEVNADCEDPANVDGGANCQADNQCLDCVVTYTSSTCGALDGGQVPNQPNCQQATRLCVAACTTNAGCAGTQGANCMANGVCFNCRNDADCAATGNAWNGDGGETPGQAVCNNATGICGARCPNNAACPNNQNCMYDGRCRACNNNADCAANDGPFPTQGANTICRNGVCFDPYQCVADANDNANCLAQTGEANCQADRTCNTCTSNDDCGALDGGVVPNQPVCNTATGICGPCTRNADCPEDAANCGADGICYDCRDLPDAEECGALDGGEIPGQPNCNPIDGICVASCTRDEHCLDECLPYCAVERGCCVECRTNDHCPHGNWRQDAAELVDCLDYKCVSEDTECFHDDDCEDAELPACDIGSGRCVECISDEHCGDDSETPACSTAQRTCVECVFDAHCSDAEVCGSDQECHDGDSDGAAIMSFLSVSLAAFLAAALRF